ATITINAMIRPVDMNAFRVCCPNRHSSRAGSHCGCPEGPATNRAAVRDAGGGVARYSLARPGASLRRRGDELDRRTRTARLPGRPRPLAGVLHPGPPPLVPAARGTPDRC